MNQREQLIEEAAKVFGGITSASWDDADEWEREKVLEGMARALAVFEGAYANDLATSSERVKNRPDSSHVIPTECLDCGRTDGGCDRIIVTPTDDEREALDSFRGWAPLEVKNAPYQAARVISTLLYKLECRTVQGYSKDLRVAESPVQGEPSSLAVQPAIDAVRMVLLGMAERMDEFAYEEISSALDDIPDCENWTAVPHAEHVQGEPTRDSEEHLRGRWSNGDPVHIITDGSNRHVAPNLNGATWIPGAVEPYDRYAEHDRAKREGGYCRGCDEKFPAPQGEPSDAQADAARIAFHEFYFGPNELLSERDLGIGRLAWKAALRAAAETGWEHRGS